MKKAIIYGGTGLTGQCLREALHASGNWQVFLAVRNSNLELYSNEKAFPIHFDRLDEHPELQEADAVFCCLGTTIRNVGGDREAFRLVDEIYPVRIAQHYSRGKTKVMAVVSAMGADTNSRIFYNRVKGNMEAGIAAADLPSVYICRPSLLMGHRKERRLGERMAQWMMPVFSPLLIGTWRHYKPIHARDVARVMVEKASNPQAGFHLILSGDMQPQRQLSKS